MLIVYTSWPARADATADRHQKYQGVERRLTAAKVLARVHVNMRDVALQKGAMTRVVNASVRLCVELAKANWCRAGTSVMQNNLEPAERETGLFANLIAAKN